MKTQEELDEFRREAETELQKYPNVVDVAFGYKRTAGVTTNEFALCVYVSEKKDKAQLAPAEMLPKAFKGVPIDVITLPEFTRLHCEDITLHDPLVSGISVTNLKESAPNSNSYGVGTLGFFATPSGVAAGDEYKNVLLVSNHHVLMANGASANASIYHPAMKDAGGGVFGVDLEHKTKVADVQDAGQDGPYAFQQDPQKHQYQIDATTAKLDYCRSSWCHTECKTEWDNAFRTTAEGSLPAIAGIATVTDADVANAPQPAGYKVFKIGRRTGYTEGKVTIAKGVEPHVITIEATHNNCNGQLQFADHGDSGSAILNAQHQLIGLLFAIETTDLKIAYACHIEPLMERFNIKPITTQHIVKHGANALSDADGVLGAQGFSNAARLRDRLLNTERGRALYALVETHRFEIVRLVNHRRPVTVAWHRNQGPAFLAHATNNARDPEYVVPREVEGVSRATLLRNMAQALTDYGSPELRAVVAAKLAEVLAHVDRSDSLHEMVAQFNECEVA